MITEIFEVTDPYVNYTEKTTLWVRVLYCTVYVFLSLFPSGACLDWPDVLIKRVRIIGTYCTWWRYNIDISSHSTYVGATVLFGHPV